MSKAKNSQAAKRAYAKAHADWMDAIRASDAARVAFEKAQKAEEKAKRRYVAASSMCVDGPIQTQGTITRYNHYARTPEMGN